MSKPKILDLFSGGGGAGTGFVQAGFDVVGVDIVDQPGYPGEFHRADVLDVLAGNTSIDPFAFDAIHASPPCQGYSDAVTSPDGKWTDYSIGVDTPKLIAPVRVVLDAIGLPYSIENVMGARDELVDPVLLCGSMFPDELMVQRHRLIEFSFDVDQPEHVDCRGRVQAYADATGWDYRDFSVTGKSRGAGCVDRWRVIMGWPGAHRGRDLTESIPPAYGRWIGERLLRRVGAHQQRATKGNLT